LIRRAKQGDRAAFAEIYNRHYTAIYRYVYWRVHSVSVAEDLAGEVFLRLVEKIDLYTPRGKPILAWLYTVARNLANDHHRHRGNAAVLPLEDWVPARGPGPLDLAHQGQVNDCLARALMCLTEEQRLVIMHKLVEGRSNREVAALLNKTEGAIKSLQHRALASLRRAVLRQGCYEP
jgi:RNA polymerase sigma-70 factor (ECF subfamily)